MADPQSILQLGIEAARAGDKAEARELFRLVTREDPHNPQGWLWLAGVAEDREEKRAALERVLQIDPNNTLAQKGLAALGGAKAASVVAPSSVPAAQPEAPVAQEAPSAPVVDEAPRPRRARAYNTPEQVGAYVPPPADDYDLREYQTAPVAAAGPPEDTTTVYVEDEEPRRRSPLGFVIPLALLTLLGAILLFFIFRTGDQPVAQEPGGASPTADAIASPSPDNEATDLLSPSPEASPEVSPAPSPEASPAPQPEPSPEASPAPQPEPSPEASPAPQPEPSPEASPAPQPEPTPEPAPEQPPVDVASANPAVVPNGEVLRAGNFEFSNFLGIYNTTSGAYGGAPPARGQYLIVLLTVRNVGDAPAQIPDGFFVVKDAQGRVSDFNRAASVDYINRFGGTGPRGAGDYAADAQLPPGAPLGSMPLLFDVAPDATDIVLFSRENVNQGFLIR